jgi:hypothetical protein
MLTPETVKNAPNAIKNASDPAAVKNASDPAVKNASDHAVKNVPVPDPPLKNASDLPLKNHAHISVSTYLPTSIEPVTKCPKPTHSLPVPSVLRQCRRRSKRAVVDAGSVLVFARPSGSATIFATGRSICNRCPLSVADRPNNDSTRRGGKLNRWSDPAKSGNVEFKVRQTHRWCGRLSVVRNALRTWMALLVCSPSSSRAMSCSAGWPARNHATACEESTAW